MSNNNYIINKTFDNQSSITTSSINVKTINDVPASQIVYVDVSNNISTENINTTYLNNKLASRIVFYDTSNNDLRITGGLKVNTLRQFNIVEPFNLLSFDTTTKEIYYSASREIKFYYLTANSSKVCVGISSSSQATNTIVLNSTGTTINSSTADSFYVSPVRNNNISPPNILCYDNSTKEIFYTTTVPSGGGGTVANLTINDTITLIGVGAGNTLSTQSIAIGYQAGSGAGNQACAIGYQAGIGAGNFSTSIGIRAGNSGQQQNTVCIGFGAASSNQGEFSVAIGGASASTSQGIYSVALGYASGHNTQQNTTVAIGAFSGYYFQGLNAIAIGCDAAGSRTVSQQSYAIAIGRSAGNTNQGTYSIAIGANAGYTNQPANSIILYAGGATALNPTTASAFYVAPIRSNNITATNCLSYDASTKEVFYTTTLPTGPTGPAGPAGPAGATGTFTGTTTQPVEIFPTVSNQSLTTPTISLYLRSRYSSTYKIFGNESPAVSVYVTNSWKFSSIGHTVNSLDAVSNTTTFNNNTALELAPNSNNGIRLTGTYTDGWDTTKFYFLTDGTFKCSSVVQTSDYRIKENVQDLVASVDYIRPVSYYNNTTKKNEMGFIAHELQTEFPNLVFGEKDGDSLQGINYTGLIPILVKEIQDLKARIALLENA